jgi:hypothetical protein
MKIINNKKEFEEFYPYDKKYIKEYPQEYPCIAKWEYEERGIMSKLSHVEFGGVVYPATEINGTLIIDYPPKKITEHGRKILEEHLINLKKEFDIKIIINDKELKKKFNNS